MIVDKTQKGIVNSGVSGVCYGEFASVIYGEVGVREADRWSGKERLRVTMLQRLQIFLIYSPGKYICDHVLIFQTIFFRNICNICIQRAKEYNNYWGF